MYAVLLLFLAGALTLSAAPCCAIEIHVASASSQPLAGALVRTGAIEARTESRRDHIVPTAYRDGGAWYGILSVAGPDRVSGERWGEAYAREYFRCVVDDGGMVWLYHDAKGDGWYIHGWWD